MPETEKTPDRKYFEESRVDECLDKSPCDLIMNDLLMSQQPTQGYQGKSNGCSMDVISYDDF